MSQGCKFDHRVSFWYLRAAVRGYLKTVAVCRSLVKHHLIAPPVIQPEVQRILDSYQLQIDYLTSGMTDVMEKLRIWHWLKQVNGIGHLLGACLLAEVKIPCLASYGQLWAYAGLVPKEVGKRLRYRRELKFLVCTKMLNSILSKRHLEDEGTFYAKLFDKIYQKEQEKNKSGGFRDKALAILARTRHKPTRLSETLKDGLLPDYQLQGRARIKTGKIFLAHFFQVGYFDLHGKLHESFGQGPCFPEAEMVPVPFFDPASYKDLPGIGLAEFYLHKCRC